MSDLYHISLDELLKGDQDMMKKIEKDTNIVRSNSRLIAVGIVAIIVAVVVTFASIMTGNAVLDSCGGASVGIHGDCPCVFSCNEKD